MSETPIRTSVGFVLLEALIAIVVLGIGVLGIAKLNGVLLQDTGVSKTRAEAVQLAQGHLESLRELIATNGCADFQDTVESSVDGLNSTFSITQAFENPVDASAMRENDRWLQVEVIVSWTGRDADAGSNQVLVTSLISCRDSRALAYAAGVEYLSDFLKTSTGRGIVDNSEYSGGGTGSANQIAGSDVADGTTTYFDDDGYVRLVDGDGRVVLRFLQTACERESLADVGFSTISGKLFVEAKNGEPIAEEDELHVLSSDASYCAKLGFDENWVLPSGATARDVEFFYTYYQCYLGPEWWGNVGVIGIDTAASNDRICVGNPLSDDDGTDYTRVPQLSSTRGYRGVLVSLGSFDEAKGIGVDDSGCGYTARHYSGHHWVYASNVRDDEGCLSVENGLDALAPTGSLGSSPGKYYCLSTNDDSCPPIEGGADAPVTVVHGQINAIDGAALVGISDTGACTTSTFSGNGPFQYSCDISWTGFAGSSWYGAIRFEAVEDATLCASEAAALVLPEGNSVAYVINDKDADPDPNALKFTDVPKEVTDVTIDFVVRDATCSVLGQPDVAWGSGDDPKVLEWPAISGATGYRVYRCEETNENDLTPCDPASLFVTTANTQFLPGDPGNKDTFCIAVEAEDGSSVGVRSPIKCLHEKNGVYSYQ